MWKNYPVLEKTHIQRNLKINGIIALAVIIPKTIWALAIIWWLDYMIRNSHVFIRRHKFEPPLCTCWFAYLFRFIRLYVHSSMNLVHSWIHWIDERTGSFINEPSSYVNISSLINKLASSFVNIIVLMNELSAFVNIHSIDQRT